MRRIEDYLERLEKLEGVEKYNTRFSSTRSTRRNHLEELVPGDPPRVAAGRLDHLLNVRSRVAHPHLVHHLAQRL